VKVFAANAVALERPAIQDRDGVCAVNAGGRRAAEPVARLRPVWSMMFS
jgi:hypothetical protein